MVSRGVSRALVSNSCVVDCILGPTMLSVLGWVVGGCMVAGNVGR